VWVGPDHSSGGRGKAMDIDEQHQQGRKKEIEAATAKKTKEADRQASGDFADNRPAKIKGRCRGLSGERSKKIPPSNAHCRDHSQKKNRLCRATDACAAEKLQGR